MKWLIFILLVACGDDKEQYLGTVVEHLKCYTKFGVTGDLLFTAEFKQFDIDKRYFDCSVTKNAVVNTTRQAHYRDDADYDLCAVQFDSDNFGMLNINTKTVDFHTKKLHGSVELICEPQ